MSITTTQTPSAVLRGNPPTDTHQPVPSEVVDLLDEIIANGASAATVDAISIGRTPRDPVATVATSNVTLSGEQTIGSVLTSTSRIAVTAQTAPEENGVYVTASGAWSRASDMDEAGDIDTSEVLVDGGDNGGEVYIFRVADPSAFTLDTDAITATKTGDAGALTVTINGKLTATSNLSDLDDAATARTNLGLGTAAESDATDFADASVGDLAISAVQSEDLDGLRVYSGSGTIIPIVTDASYGVIFGYDTGAAGLVGQGLARAEDGQARYTGSGGTIPIITDGEFGVILGVNKADGALVAPSLTTTTDNSAPLEALGVDVASGTKYLFQGNGQSNEEGDSTTSALSTTQPYSNVMFNGGTSPEGGAGDLASLVALVETTKERPVTGAANRFTSLLAEQGVAPSDAVVLACTAAEGGTEVGSLRKGSTIYDTDILPQIQAAASLQSGIVCLATTVTQGERDSVIGTTKADFKAEWLAWWAEYTADIKAELGQSEDVHVLVAQHARGANTSSTPELQDAWVELDRESTYFHCVLPIYWMDHLGDNLHLTSAAQKLKGFYQARAMDELRRGYRPRALRPVSATRRGSEIRVKFSVPTLPLVFDETNLPDTTDHGFAVEDSGGVMTISSIAIDGDTVVITVSGTPSGATEVRYAHDYTASGFTVQASASGNLRDSTADTATVDGTEYQMFHVAPHFTLTVYELSE